MLTADSSDFDGERNLVENRLCRSSCNRLFLERPRSDIDRGASKPLCLAVG